MRLKPETKLPGLTKKSLGEELLRTHKNYQPLLARVPAKLIHGLAHITGGGLVDNPPRVLPRDCDAIIETGRWKVPAIFQILARHGRIEREEMYQVFNMGIGMIAIVAEKNARDMAGQLQAKPIGRVAAGSGITQLVF